MNGQNQQTANESDTVNDLTVAADAANEVKGGPRSVVLPWIAQTRGALALPDLEPQGEVKGEPTGSGTYTGSTLLNHNETTMEDEEAEAEALDDLTPQEDVNGGGNQGWGRWEINHNETVAVEDGEDAEATALLADLPVVVDQAEQISGGPLTNNNTYSGTTTINNGTLNIR
jgi:hypothetical protein